MSKVVVYKKTKTETKEVELNFEKVCRTCLSDKNQLINIFEVAFEGVNIPEIFDNYMKMQVEENDDLPQNICYTCLYEMCHIYMFINNSKKVEDKLYRLLNIVNAKDTVEDEIVEGNVKDKDSASELDVKDEQETEEESDDFESEIKMEKKETENDEYDVKKEEQDMEDNEEECDDDEDEKEGTVDLLKLGPIRVPEIGPPFTCFCGDEYGTVEELKEHRSMRKHSKNIKRYLCRICSPSKLYSYKAWFSHMKSHNNDKLYQCELCGSMSKSAHNHYRHLRSHNGEKLFICEICGKSFSRSTGLKQHKLSHYTENEVIENNHRKVNYCDKCDERFSGELAYNKHMYDVHATSPFICHTCGKSFAHKGSLYTHFLVHSGKKEFKCTICNRSFVQKNHLITHYKVHTGEKPYACPYCGKKFALNGNLTVHKRVHTGEKPYICNICDKGFYDSSSMKTHRKRHF